MGGGGEKKSWLFFFLGGDHYIVVNNGNHLELVLKLSAIHVPLDREPCIILPFWFFFEEPGSKPNPNLLGDFFTSAAATSTTTSNTTNISNNNSQNLIGFDDFGFGGGDEKPKTKTTSKKKKKDKKNKKKKNNFDADDFGFPEVNAFLFLTYFCWNRFLIFGKVSEDFWKQSMLRLLAFQENFLWGEIFSWYRYFFL